MSQDQHVSSAARRYARALFELVSEAGRHDVVSAQMEQLGGLVNDSEFRALLLDPRVESGPKAKAILGGFGEQVDPLLVGLIESLARRKRLSQLVGIPTAYRDFSDEAAGRVRGELESSHLMAENQVVTIEQALSKKTGKEVSLHCTVTPELLGGVRVTLAGTCYDGSARGRLDQLSQRLAAVELD